MFRLHKEKKGEIEGIIDEKLRAKEKKRVLLLLLLLITAIELSLGGSSPYTDTHKTKITNKNENT